MNFKFFPELLHFFETSAYYGVYWDKHAQKWHAQRCSQGKNYFGGLFSTELEAAKKSDELARKHSGDRATLNFPTESEKRKRRKNKVLFVTELLFEHFNIWNITLINFIFWFHMASVVLFLRSQLTSGLSGVRHVENGRLPETGKANFTMEDFLLMN